MADDLKPAYLLAGGDRPKIDRALGRLRARFGEDAVEIHAARETTGEDAVAACNTPGLFGGSGRLVIIEGVEAWKAPDAKAIASYLKAPTPDTVLALIAAELKRDAPLAKAIAGSGELRLWDVAQRGIPAWVAEQFKLRSAQADIDACRTLIEFVGDDLYELAGEVDKLSTWAAGERLTQSEVECLVAPRAQSSSFALTDAWGARNVGAVLRASELLLERTGDPRSKTIPRLVGTLTTHVTRVRACQTLDAEGVTSKDAAGRLKQHPFYVQKLYAQARNYSREELRDVTLRLADLDHCLKGGSRLAAELELERALVDVTREREQGPTRAN